MDMITVGIDVSLDRLDVAVQVRSFDRRGGDRPLCGGDHKPEVRPLPDEATQMLADLVARRRQIVEMIGAERQREKRMTRRHLKADIARLIKTLE